MEALAVRNEEKGGALYPHEPRESPFRDFGVNVRVRYPVSEVAAKYGASVAEETFDPDQAYVDWPATTSRFGCPGRLSNSAS